MKTLIRVMSLLCAMALLQNCAEEESLRPEKVQFSFAVSDPDHSGGRIQTQLPTGTVLVISLQTTSGTPVLTNHKVGLLNMGGGVITEPLELAPNHYIVTDFMLVNNGEVLYATPKKGSLLAQAVINPVPFGFSVFKNKVTNIEMEVMDVRQHMPRDFGYVSFGINVKRAFQLAVFAPIDGKTVLTSAKITILQNEKTLTTMSVDEKVNLISFGGDPEQLYTLVVEKDNFVAFTRTFNVEELLSEIKGLPLKVTLKPVMKMLVFIDEDVSDIFSIYLTADDYLPASLHIDWGDGSSEDIGVGGTFLLVSHSYAAPGNYLVKLTGTLDRIKIFKSYYGEGMIDKINFDHLIGLTEVRIGLTRGPKVVDLSHNVNLNMIDLAGVSQLERIVLPSSHSISSIHIQGPNLLTTAMVDQVVSNIYENAKARNIVNGLFSLDASWMQDPSADHSMVGPPSTASLEKLQALRLSYQWSISPYFWE